MARGSFLQNQLPATEKLPWGSPAVSSPRENDDQVALVLSQRYVQIASVPLGTVRMSSELLWLKARTWWAKHFLNGIAFHTKTLMRITGMGGKPGWFICWKILKRMISSIKKPCVSLAFRKIITLLHVGKSWGMFAEFTAAVKHGLGDRFWATSAGLFSYLQHPKSLSWQNHRMTEILSHDGSMVLLYMVAWIPSIYPQSMFAYIPAPWIRHGL